MNGNLNMDSSMITGQTPFFWGGSNGWVERSRKPLNGPCGEMFFWHCSHDGLIFWLFPQLIDKMNGQNVKNGEFPGPTVLKFHTTWWVPRSENRRSNKFLSGKLEILNFQKSLLEKWLTILQLSTLSTISLVIKMIYCSNWGFGLFCTCFDRK